MNAATLTRPRARVARLLVVDRARESIVDIPFGRIAEHVRANDLFVVNDAATLPASLEARTALGEVVEVRLVSPVSAEDATPDAQRWHAVLFGEGDFRTPTESRPRPPRIVPGDVLDFGALEARVRALSPISNRLVELEIDRGGAAFWTALYATGHPIQYAYMRERLSIADVQTPFASRPWAVEMPSAGRLLSASMRQGMIARGARFATLTHAAGLSSTGDPAIDAALPLPERYALPEHTVAAIESTLARGGRVLAVGTTVARALEGNVHTHGALTPGTYVTDLKLGPSTVRRVVSGMLTGTHAPDTSHFDLLRAFASDALLERVVETSEHSGYLLHEFGDNWLIV